MKSRWNYLFTYIFLLALSAVGWSVADGTPPDNKPPLTVDINADTNGDSAWDGDDEQSDINPGMKIFANVDNDNLSNGADCSDQSLDLDDENPERSDDDMVDIYVDLKTIERPWGANDSLSLESSNYDRIRVFKVDGTELLGPTAGMNQPYVFSAQDIPENGRLKLYVEGVDQAGTSTLSLVFKKGSNTAAQDSVKFTIKDNVSDNSSFDFKTQHKDTGIICLDCVGNTLENHGPYEDHKAYDPSCDHCEWYCVRASLAMMNSFYGGDITQDEISYYYGTQLNSFSSGGDLGHGHGIDDDQLDDGLFWVLGISESDLKGGSAITANNVDMLVQQYIEDSVLKGHPVFAGMRRTDGSLHAIVITGVRNESLIKYLVADPLDSHTWSYAHSYFFFKAMAIDENASTSARSTDSDVDDDNDEDSIVTFDEKSRFPEFDLDPEVWNDIQLILDGGD